MPTRRTYSTETVHWCTSSPSWVIGPLAVLCLVGAELNALSWELGGAEAGREAMRARGMSIARVAVAGLVAAMVVVAITRVTLLTETVATVVAAAALLGLGLVVLPASAPDDDVPSDERESMVDTGSLPH